ncbi:MAG TPA: tetratricopeptide repeat protein [Bryobacteraceae bacterium]|nr:tetratricopeptide repeat protein [Bryobacteraceae bacterium]
MVSIRIVSFILITALPAMPQLTASRSVPNSAQPGEGARQLTPEQRADVLMARKMYRDAIEAYREAPQTSAVIMNKIGIAYHQLGDFAAARKHYERAMKLDKHYADAVNNSGTVFYALKSYRSAIARYKKALQLAPDTASFWSNLGTAEYSRGKYAEMSEAYQKALQLDPNIFERRGTIGTELQDRTVTDRARYHFELARLYAKSGKYELALQYLRRALEEGLKDKVKMTQTPEFTELRETDEFKLIMAMEPRVL